MIFRRVCSYLTVLAITGAVGCADVPASSEGADDGGTGGADDGNLPQEDLGMEGIPAEGGLTIKRVEVNQGVGIDIARDGAWLDGPQRIANIIYGRETIVRAFWTLPADWTPRTMEARLHLRYTDGTQTVQSFELEVAGPSDPSDLATGAFGWLLEPAELQPDMEFRVTLWELGDGPKTESPVEATDGWSVVGVEKAPAEIRAVIVPVIYSDNPEGCETDMTALTDAQYQGFADYLQDQNPAQDVILTVREEPILRTSSINGPSNFFSQLQQIRLDDDAAPNEYYYGLYDDCGGAAGTLGAAPSDNVPPTKEAAQGRIAAGRWFSDAQAPVTWSTFLHEVGHTQSFAHTPCGADGNMPASPDPAYPYSGGEIGVWGVNTRTLKGYEPASAFDYMGYCDPSWVSDYRWRLAFEQIRALTSWDYEYAPAPEVPAMHLLQGLLYEDGSQEWWTTLGAPTPARDFVPSVVTVRPDLSSPREVEAQVWEVQDTEQQVRMVSAVLPEGVTHLSQIDSLELVTQGELWTPTAAQLHDDVSR
jgi:hypothetical protein